MKHISLYLLLCVTVVALSTSLASADAILVSTSGTIALGVNDLGHLNVSRNPPGPTGAPLNPRDGGIGITLVGLGEGTYPGCLCEGWGVAGNGVSGWADVAAGGSFNLTLGSFATDDPGGAAGSGTFATSTVTLTSLPTLSVVQSYMTATETSDLFVNHVVITNTGGVTITDVRYTRSMDWDIAPTEFNEFVTHGGVLTTAALLYSSDDGFQTPDPLTGRSPINAATENTDFVDNGPDDHGSLFDFGFGDLAPGESIEFDIFYGATQNEADAFAALTAVGAELYSLGQSNTAFGPSLGTPGTYIFAFRGVGGVPLDVPEPGTMVLLGSGLGLLGAFCVRRARNRKREVSA